MDWWKIVAVAVVAWVALDFLGRLPIARACLGFFEKIPSLHLQRGQPNELAEVVEFPTTDGLTLRGGLYRQTDRPSRGLVVFCHEFGGDHWMALDYCQAVWDAGFDVFAFDFRNHGDSDHLPKYNSLYWLTEYEVQDLSAALRYVRSRSDVAGLPISFFGVSRGGSAALAVAATDPSIRCVFCDSSFSIETMMLQYAWRWAHLVVPEWTIKLVPEWHLAITMRLTRFWSQLRSGVKFVELRPTLRRMRGRPVSLVAGGRDTYVPIEVAYDMARRLGPSASLWVVEKANHNAPRRTEREAYDERVTAFFLEHASRVLPEDEAPAVLPVRAQTPRRAS